MFNAQVIQSGDTLKAVRERMDESPTLMNNNIQKYVIPLFVETIDRLSTYPGQPSYPLRWASERSQRFYFGFVARRDADGNIIPYRRTGRLAQGWDYSIQNIRNGGEFSISNDAPYAEFVQGPRAQPFHLDTGWQQPEPLIADLDVQVDDALVTAWAETGDQIAGGR